jgi:hypothetical protein
MFNFSVVETIQILKRRRSHFADVVAGLATLDDFEIVICADLMSLRAGRSDAADFGQHSLDPTTFSHSDGASMIIKQLDVVLASLRECMFDEIDGEVITNDAFAAKARKAIEPLDPRLFSVPLLTLLQPLDHIAAESEFLVSVPEDHRLSKFRVYQQLRRQPQLPLVDTTSSLSACIPGWPGLQVSETLDTSVSPSLVPSFVRALDSSEECVYGARRHESATWMQKHKRLASTK